MTTIAADIRSMSMAGDRQCVDASGDLLCPAVKVHKLRTFATVEELSPGFILFPNTDFLVGMAGNLFLRDFLHRWVKSGMSPLHPPRVASPSIDFAALILTATAMFAVGSDFAPLREEILPFFAIGSGAKAAMAALYLGTDVKIAVEIAAKCDSRTGLGTDVVFLDRD